jgi:hypothetical protein
MRSSLLASVDVIEFQTTDAYSILDLTNVMYNRSIHSSDEIIIIIIIIWIDCSLVFVGGSCVLLVMLGTQ